MTATVLQRGTRSGGVPARRAVTRWTWRLLRRDWRQQILLVTLVTFAVAAALFAIVAMYNGPQSASAVFGNADHRIMLSGDDPAAISAVAAELDAQYGPTELIGHSPVPVPGSVDTVELRTQDVAGRLGAPMLSLLRGRYPTAATEVAVTDGAAASLDLQLGQRASVNGLERTVVGIIENPASLHDEFILTTPSASDAPTSATVLVAGHDTELGNEHGRIRRLDVSDGSVQALSQVRDDIRRGSNALVMLLLDTVAMLLVSLVAAAAFVVVAQRRLRQLGMLSAIGATNRNLRLAMVAHGFCVGVLTAIAGSCIALASWFTFAPRLESLVGHRIDRTDLPIGVLAFAAVLAVVTTTAAAWWPARAVSRVPVIRALSGRPPAPARVHRSALLGLVFLAIGVLILAFGIHADGTATAFVGITGPIAVVLGILFICPLAIRVLAPVAKRLPIAARLALRDLVRYQARAGGALAAISLGLGIAITAIVITAAATPPASSGNLSRGQLLFRLNAQGFIPDVSTAQLQQIDAAIDDLAMQYGATVYPLDVAMPASATSDSGARKPLLLGDSDGQTGRMPVVLGVPEDHGVHSSERDYPYVATPELLARAGVDAATIAPDTDVVTPLTDPLVFLDGSGASRGLDPLLHVQHVHDRYTGEPTTLILPSAMRSHGWETARAGWFVETTHPLSSRQISKARKLAASLGIVAISRDDHHELAITRSVATAGGMLLALGIIAMTIGLIRGEATRDLQTLTATGATSTSRRAITATTAAALALLGALLGLIGAYIALLAGYSDDLHPLRQVPVSNLATIVFGLPALAAVAGWLLAGRQPPAINRQALE